MKIGDSIKKTTGLGIATEQTRAGKGTEKAGGVPSQAASSSVSLSSNAQALSGHIADNSVFDARKVEEIKSAIAEGRFKVDPEKVANGLLDTVSDLLRTRKG